ncbi:MAG: hypothetical protein LBP76_13855 [Treponema sp.]|jgi:regulator of replication initiation timing|nr:hypothetical protein [Treponema sp.]
MAKEPAMGLTFEQIWALFQETDRKMQETDRKMQETDRKMQETDRKIQEMVEENRRISQETDRKIQETFDKTNLILDKRFKQTHKEIGALSNRVGEIVEHLMSPKLHKQFRSLGYRFENMSRDYEIYDSADRHLVEVDVFLENGDYALAVEVKSKPSQNDVDGHVKRLELLRGWADRRHDRRKFLGALAGAVIKAEVRDYAFKRGFFVIEQSGETIEVGKPPAPWEPRVW